MKKTIVAGLILLLISSAAIAQSDGYISPVERKRLHKIKRKARRDAFRCKMNKRRRII